MPIRTELTFGFSLTGRIARLGRTPIDGTQLTEWTFVLEDDDAAYVVQTKTEPAWSAGIGNAHVLSITSPGDEVVLSFDSEFDKDKGRARSFRNSTLEAVLPGRLAT